MVYIIKSIQLIMSVKSIRTSGIIQKKTSSEIICQNFGIENQTIFQDYRCTYKQKISYFGRLYVGEEHIMFVSSMFGIVKKIAISIDKITKIQQPQLKNILIIATRQYKANEGSFLFCGFENDHAIKIIMALWKREKLSSQIILNNEEDKQNEIGENLILNLDKSQMQINLFQEKGVEKQPIKMLQIVFPCSVQQFYDFFLADNADLYGKKQHLQLRKAHSIKITPWKKIQQLNAQTRQINAVIKVKGVPLMNQARMSQVCMLSRNQQNQINLKAVTNMGDVPYHSYFNCEQHITVTKEGDTKCRYIVKSAIIFNKNTYMKSTIINKTFADFNQEYKMWSDNCKLALQTKIKKLQQVARSGQIKKIDRNIQNSVEFQSHILQDQQKQKQEDVVMSVKQCIQIRKQVNSIKEQVNYIQRNIRKQNILITILLILHFISSFWIYFK